MYDFEDLLFGILILSVVAFLLIGVPVLIYLGGVHTAEVWNECHPSVQITTRQAMFAKIEIDVCETGVLEQDE